MPLRERLHVRHIPMCAQDGCPFYINMYNLNGERRSVFDQRAGVLSQVLGKVRACRRSHELAWARVRWHAIA